MFLKYTSVISFCNVVLFTQLPIFDFVQRDTRRPRSAPGPGDGGPGQRPETAATEPWSQRTVPTAHLCGGRRLQRRAAEPTDTRRTYAKLSSLTGYRAACIPEGGHGTRHEDAREQDGSRRPGAGTHPWLCHEANGISAFWLNERLWVLLGFPIFFSSCVLLLKTQGP